MAYKNYEDHKRNVRERLAALTPEEAASRVQKKREWRLRNKERLREKDRAYYEANKEKRAEAGKIRRGNPDKNLGDKIKKYGITVEDFKKLQTLQRGRCAICRTYAPTGRGRWHVDHCHETGKVRGLLCSGCNTGMGHFKDDPSTLRKAATYLERHGK